MTTLESQPRYEEELPDQLEGTQPDRLETHDFGNGQILHYNPSSHRLDEKTGEPVIPLVYFQGINGDESLPAVMEALGERDQRPVIGLRYRGKLRGSAKPITAEHPDYSKDADIPEIEIEQADDAIAALQVMGIKKVDALATSRGGLRWLLAMKKQPELFRNAYGDDVAGQDGRNYTETHRDAARLVVAQRLGKLAGKGAFESVLDDANVVAWPKRSAKDLRTEQKSVAYAQFGNLLTEVATDPNNRINIRLGSDKGDRAFRTENVRSTMEQAGAHEHVTLVETDKGGHGIGTNSQAINEAIAQLREMERTEDSQEFEIAA